MKNPTCLLFTLGAFGSAAVPTAAQAQVWIGQIVGQIAADRAAAEREKACIAGAPAPEGVVTNATTQSRELMSAYFALTSQSKPKDVGRVFALKQEDVSWKSAAGALPVNALGKVLDEPTPTVEPTSFIVGGDGATARGIWAVTGATDAAQTHFYAVDFTRGLGFKGSWRVWHMALFPADSPPAPPSAYCHYSPDQAW